MAFGFEQQADWIERPAHPMRTEAQAHIQDAAHALAQGDTATAYVLIQPFLAPPHPQATPEERLAYLFARSLLARMLPTAETHLPVLSDDLASRAAQAWLEIAPFRLFGYASANAAILRALMGAKDMSIVDIGIDGPWQWVHLLQLLAHAPLRPQSVQIIGVRLPIPGLYPSPYRRDDIRRSLMSCAEELGINLSYREVDAAQGQLPAPTVQALAGPAPIVNAAFALHHIAADDAASIPRQPRDTMLRDIARLRPRLMTLVEPDVEHNALPFSARISASWYYYRGMFEVLQSYFPASMPERWGIEQAMLGHEIHNVVTCEGADRTQRHERWRAWVRRLQAQGFQQVSLHTHEYYVNKTLASPLGTYATTENGALVLRWEDIPLIAASAWRRERP
ncbi:GRAS family protein [Chloroflexia bacterium SDU3-3]|nr:GRAS family protein [Chloroflexia bacterium SDU3-3]